MIATTTMYVLCVYMIVPQCVFLHKRSGTVNCVVVVVHREYV